MCIYFEIFLFNMYSLYNKINEAERYMLKCPISSDYYFNVKKKTTRGRKRARRARLTFREVQHNARVPIRNGGQRAREKRGRRPFLKSRVPTAGGWRAR